MTDTVAYEQGRAAFLDGYADDVNPYHYRTQAHEDWLAGWDAEASRYVEPARLWA